MSALLKIMHANECALKRAPEAMSKFGGGLTEKSQTNNLLVNLNLISVLKNIYDISRTSVQLVSAILKFFYGVAVFQ